jgi:dGTPase
MEAADGFCYGILDLEDGLEMDILKWEEIYEILKPILEKSQVTDLESDFLNVCDRGKPAIIRGKIISSYIDAAAKAFIENEQNFLNGEIEGDLISLCPDKIRHSVEEAKRIAKMKIFSHPRKVELEIGSYYVISTLLEVMCAAAKEWVEKKPDELSYKSKRVIDLIGKNTFDLIDSSEPPHTRKYLAIMRVIDFISGMTDHYATYLAKQFNGMGQAR